VEKRNPLCHLPNRLPPKIRSDREWPLAARKRCAIFLISAHGPARAGRSLKSAAPPAPPPPGPSDRPAARRSA
jgi:hypothetical protein